MQLKKIELSFLNNLSKFELIKVFITLLVIISLNTVLLLNESAQAHELDRFHKPFGLELDTTTLEDFKLRFTRTKTMHITGKSKERHGEVELMVEKESLSKITSKDVVFYNNFNAISSIFNDKEILKTIVLSYTPISFFDDFVVQINNFCKLRETHIYKNNPNTPQLLYQCGNIWVKVTVFDEFFLLKLSTDKDGLLYQ